MKLLCFLLLVVLPCGALCADEQPGQWTKEIPKLFGSWESDSIKARGVAAKIKFTITFLEDGTFVTEEFRGGDSSGKQRGVYAVGKDHIYLWSGGPPSDDLDQDPDDYYRALLMSFKFDGDKLKVEFLEGSPPGRSFTLSRAKAEQGGAGQPATATESKSKGEEKPQPEAEGRSR